MAIKALGGISPEWYTPGSDDDDNPTRFQVKPLTVEQFEQVVVYNENGVLTLPVPNYAKVLKYGVIGWENFAGDTGDVKFSIVNLSLIPTAVRTELAMHIMNLSLLRESEAKNF